MGGGLELNYTKIAKAAKIDESLITDVPPTSLFELRRAG
jgi:hypothetical protein